MLRRIYPTTAVTGPTGGPSASRLPALPSATPARLASPNEAAGVPASVAGPARKVLG